MSIFLLIYTVAMIAGSVLTLTLVPRSLKDLGRERERLHESLPDASYERMVEAGYRFNFVVLLLEILYYYLLVGFGRDQWQLFYGGAFFGLVHIVFLAYGRLEKRRLKKDYTRSRLARLMIWVTAIITAFEVGFLILVFYLLLADLR
jgi:hypothetical protein